MESILNFYTTAKEYVLNNGYKHEVDYCINRKSFDFCTSEEFFFEYVYVVLNSGMKEQIARKIYEKFCKDLDLNTIGHLGKRKAISEAINNYKYWFSELNKIEKDINRIEYLQTLPFIGIITKYHLARNIGIDTVKPDRHMIRLAAHFNFNTPLEMCEHIKLQTHEKLGVIDVILWRYCNLTGSRKI